VALLKRLREVAFLSVALAYGLFGGVVLVADCAAYFSFVGNYAFND